MRPTTTDLPSTTPEAGRRGPAGGTSAAACGSASGAQPHPTGAGGAAPPDPLGDRVDALGELLGLSRTRIAPDALAETAELLERIGERRRLSLDHTVVALAGATGSGKSALFNALAGLPLSATRHAQAHHRPAGLLRLVPGAGRRAARPHGHRAPGPLRPPWRTDPRPRRPVRPRGHR